MMTDHKQFVQPSAAVGQTSGNNLIPESPNFRQACRAAAWFNLIAGVATGRTPEFIEMNLVGPSRESGAAQFSGHS